MANENTLKMVNAILNLHQPKSHQAGPGGGEHGDSSTKKIGEGYDHHKGESTDPDDYKEEVENRETQTISAEFMGLSVDQGDSKLKAEFKNAPLEKIRERILEFKHTRSPELFANLIFFRFELFLFYICRRFQKKYTFLRNIPINDLYHAAIIATYKSFISMPVDWKMELVLQRVKSYVRQDFFTLFNDKVELRTYRLEDYEWDVGETKSSQILQDRINWLIISDTLPTEDKDLLEKKFIENRTFKSLSQEYGGISKQALSARVNKILRKCRSVVDKE